MHLPLVVHTVGLILRAFAPILLLPILVDLLYGERGMVPGFALAAAAALAAGELARRAHRGGRELQRTEGLAVVSSAWLVIPLFGAIPYGWAGLGIVDALFESMSGFTTTGASVLTSFADYSRGLFFWRALSQWLGGMGVLALFIAVLPALAVAGRQLFFAEAPGPLDQRLTPRIRYTAIALWSLYAGLTGLQVVLLVATGLPLYDAVCHAFTTLSTGGFSPHPGSVGGFANPAAEWVILGFMLLAGANFALQYRALRGRPGPLLRDEEIRIYLLVVVAAGALLTAALWDPARAPADTIRTALFQGVSILTSTGFATEDFNLWNDRARVLLLVLMFVGGCAGSSAGGPKVVRIWLIIKSAGSEIVRALHPRAIRPVHLGSRVVPAEVMRAITAFMLLYLLLFAAGTLAVVAMGADLITGASASIATLGNIGPGFNLVGPMANYAHLPALSKGVLILNMWIGRLEVLTVLVLLHPDAWRTVRLRERSDRWRSR